MATRSTCCGPQWKVWDETQISKKIVACYCHTQHLLRAIADGPEQDHQKQRPTTATRSTGYRPQQACVQKSDISFVFVNFNRMAFWSIEDLISLTIVDLFEDRERKMRTFLFTGVFQTRQIYTFGEAKMTRFRIGEYKVQGETRFS